MYIPCRLVSGTVGFIKLHAIAKDKNQISLQFSDRLVVQHAFFFNSSKIHRLGNVRIISALELWISFDNWNPKELFRVQFSLEAPVNTKVSGHCFTLTHSFRWHGHTVNVPIVRALHW
jgi:hypothetical protein